MLTVGTIINDRYELTDFIAPGGMGEVWKAKDVVLHRNVALKMVNGHYLLQNSNASAVLADEASAGASLISHPNVVSVLDFGEHEILGNKNLYIVMELVNGPNLEKWIEEYRQVLDPTTYLYISFFIALEICKAIGFAHRKGILHRDIKPLNIYVSDIGLCKVGDFGLARFIDAATRAHTVWNVSSPAYTAPEQWKGEKPGRATDLYQLGCTLYQLFTGCTPFSEQTQAAMINAHLNKIPMAPHDIDNNISEELSNKILNLLEKSPNDRESLWQLTDVLASEIQSKYDFIGDFSTRSESEVKLIGKITEIDLKAMKESKITVSFPDYAQILSVGIELILNGILDFKIIKSQPEAQTIVGTKH